MDGQQFRETVETARETELTRLGSSKLLVALTDGSIDRETVLQVAAHSENAAHETFSQWVATETDPAARAAFEAVAEQEADHRRRVLDALDDPSFEPADGGPMHAYLRGRDETIERVAAGMVGRPLVSRRTHTQLIGFFVNEADTAGADLFRDLRDETEAVVDDGLELLAERCETDDDWDRARAVATYVIRVAYDDYADSLESMGMNPKSIC
jgi:hypothetical protein